MLRRIGSGIGVVCGFIGHTSLANAADEPFGTPGQVVISGGLAYGSESVLRATAAVDNHRWVSIMPGADIFVVRGLSMGGRVGYAKSLPSFQDEYVMREDGVTVGPSVGYALNLNDRLSLWPNLEAGFGLKWIDLETDVPFPVTRGTTISFGGALPLVFWAAPRFLLGFGPSLTRTALTANSVTTHTTRLATNAYVGGSF
jgi:hypothetical protein